MSEPTAREAFEIMKASGLTPIDVNSAYPKHADAAFRARLANAVEVDGARLIEDKSQLKGLPFLVTSVTFRDGNIRTEKVDGKKIEVPSNYASIEATVYDAALLQRAVNRRLIAKSTAELFDPLERIVFNDGSTGLCRSLVQFLHNRGVISVPDGPDGGGVGESRFDTYRANWLASDVPLTPDTDPRYEFDLACPRGLRVSEYDGPNGPAGTYYFA